MFMKGNTVLIADDDTSIIAALNMLLHAHQYEVVAVTTPEALIEQVKNHEFAVVLMDLNYRKDTTSGQEGFSLIEKIKALDEHLPIIAMTGYSSIEVAVEAMKLGAADFVQKPWSNERLLHTIATQINLSKVQQAGDKLAQENALLKQQINPEPEGIIAQSPAMKTLLTQLQKLAQSDMSILLTGENGTGKSMLAEYVHKNSHRRASPFIAVNMGAISETLFESEMFGHVKGAFTDAKSNRIGRFELAQSGTIFLDEIANISTNEQAKLLRVLEEKQFERVGSSKTQSIDARLISATNADLEQLVDNESFRKDLLYRLNTVSIHIPALRERIEDIVPLAEQFIAVLAKKYRQPVKQLSSQAKHKLEHYLWPGNVRELSHILERAMFLSVGDCIEEQDLAITPQTTKDSLQSSTGKPSEVNHALSINSLDWAKLSLDEIEKSIIESRLTQFDNNPQKTADSLGLSRSAYYRRLEKYNINAG